MPPASRISSAFVEGMRSRRRWMNFWFLLALSAVSRVVFSPRSSCAKSSGADVVARSRGPARPSPIRACRLVERAPRAQCVACFGRHLAHRAPAGPSPLTCSGVEAELARHARRACVFVRRRSLACRSARRSRQRLRRLAARTMARAGPTTGRAVGCPISLLRRRAVRVESGDFRNLEVALDGPRPRLRGWSRLVGSVPCRH